MRHPPLARRAAPAAPAAPDAPALRSNVWSGAWPPRLALVALLASLPAVALGESELCPSPTGQPAPAAPTRAGYAQLLGELQRDYAARLGAAAGELDRQLDRAGGDADGSNAALPLSMVGGAHAAVYTTLWSCRRKPDAPLFASNLGSLLDGVDDPRAGQVLAYAVALATGAALPRLNLGWWQFHRGNLAAARSSFAMAARTAPGSGPVLLAQGMVAHCEGDRRRAVELLSRALSRMSSRAAEQALDEASQPPDEGPDPPAEPPAPGEPSPIPRRDDWTRNARPGRVAIAEPYLAGSNLAAITEGLSRNGAIVSGYDQRTRQLLARQQRLEPNAGRDRPPVRTATSTTLFRSDEAMVALARLQYAAYAARIRAVRSPFEKDFDARRERVSSRVQDLLAEAQAQPEKLLAIFCPAAKAALEKEYAGFKAIWRGTWEAERTLVREYGETAGATISQIRHDDLRTYLDIERQLHVIGWGLEGPGDVVGWATLGGAIMICGEPPAPLPDGTVDPSDDVGKGHCPPFLKSGFGLACGVASVSVDCEKVTVQGGEGLIGRFQHDYVRHEQTYYLGVGVAAGFGAGPLGAGVEGSVGAFVTTGGGQFRDFGYEGAAGASVGPISVGAGVTVGAVSGPSTSSSATFNAGPASVGVP